MKRILLMLALATGLSGCYSGYYGPRPYRVYRVYRGPGYYAHPYYHRW